MKYMLEIEMENDLFKNGGAGREVARILRAEATSVMAAALNPSYSKTLLDDNGNGVGRSRVSRGKVKR